MVRPIAGKTREKHGVYAGPKPSLRGKNDSDAGGMFYPVRPNLSWSTNTDLVMCHFQQEARADDERLGDAETPQVTSVDMNTKVDLKTSIDIFRAAGEDINSGCVNVLFPNV